MDQAEAMIRASGYNGFSFRDIAANIGIKSSSVHHHFPTKEDLAIAVASRYSDNFFTALGEPILDHKTTVDSLDHYCAVFENAFVSSGKSCLCATLSNESALLPEKLRECISTFVDANIAWLEKAISRDPKTISQQHRDQAHLLFSALEGAMGAAALKQDLGWLKTVGNTACRSILGL